MTVRLKSAMDGVERQRGGGWRRGAAAGTCLVALVLCVGALVGRQPRSGGVVLLGEAPAGGSASATALQAEGGAAGQAAGEPQARLPLASVASLASKVLLEQSQEAAAAGQRMVLAASHAHSTVLQDAEHRTKAMGMQQKMDALASKDAVEGDSAQKKAKQASEAAEAAEEARNAHTRKAKTAEAEALHADKESAQDNLEARELERDAVKAAREAEENKEGIEHSAHEISEYSCPAALTGMSLQSACVSTCLPTRARAHTHTRSLSVSCTCLTLRALRAEHAEHQSFKTGLSHQQGLECGDAG